MIEINGQAINPRFVATIGPVVRARGQRYLFDVALAGLAEPLSITFESAEAADEARTTLVDALDRLEGLHPRPHARRGRLPRMG